MALTKVGSPKPVTAGDNLTYTLEATNNGPSVASSVTVSDPLPAGTTFVSVTPSAGTCSESAGTVSCSLGDLAVGTDCHHRHHGDGRRQRAGRAVDQHGHRLVADAGPDQLQQHGHRRDRRRRQKPTWS